MENCYAAFFFKRDYFCAIDSMVYGIIVENISQRSENRMRMVCSRIWSTKNASDKKYTEIIENSTATTLMMVAQPPPPPPPPSATVAAAANSTTNRQIVLRSNFMLT